MKKKPLALGLTGSIGMGKTETAKLFARLGVPVYDADQIVHALYDKGGAAVAPIAEMFPDVVRDGSVDRVALLNRVANEDGAFEQLENIVHPLAARLRKDFLDKAAEDGADVALLDIPLLFETGADAEVDKVVVVSAPPEVQRARVLSRPGMTLEKFEMIHARQIPDAEKRAKADFVIDTGKGFDHAYDAVKTIVELLRAQPPKRT